MKSGIIKLRYSILSILFLLVFSSCEDPELDALMVEYCDCISASRYDNSKHIECIEKMDSIKMKYEGQPRKMKKILEKTDECY